MNIQTHQKAATLGELKAAGYVAKSIKEELRHNLIQALKHDENPFTGILGYEETVIPQIYRAILAGHSINLLGLRGQAKTSIARKMINLLDEYIPCIAGAEINDDPLNPISYFGKQLIADLGDNTPIEWIHRSTRYSEKLATPDVTVADLIGDLDPIKAANQGLSYSDERAIHFGIIPRANRGIFVINELPDLQARIQVALFNILQEGDIQIRGFKVRLPLDLQFVFTANPEDYTNRGSIVTPLKDRIQSQIITHYPQSRDIAAAITEQEAYIPSEQEVEILIPSLVSDVVEQISFSARESEMIDQKSGVSARLSISAMELLRSAVELRGIKAGEKAPLVRMMDVYATVPAITGKVELVYEGEQEGAAGVAFQLIGASIRAIFPTIFPDPKRIRKEKMENPFIEVINWFQGNIVEINEDMSDAAYKKAIGKVDGLWELTSRYVPHTNGDDVLIYMEFILFGLAEYSLISLTHSDSGAVFTDVLGAIFKDDDDAPDNPFNSGFDEDDEDDDEDDSF